MNFFQFFRQKVAPDVAEIEALQKIDLSLNPICDELDAAARKGPDVLIKYIRSNEYRTIYANAK